MRGSIEFVPGEVDGNEEICLIVAAVFLLSGVAASRAADLTRISNETGVSEDTLRAERTSTGLGWGEIEKAHLLANVSGKNFDDIVAAHQSGQGWGKIARDNGLKLGDVVSNAHRSSKAVSQSQNMQTVRGKNSAVHGKSASHMSRTHGRSMTMGNIRRGSSARTTRAGIHGMGGMHHGGGHGR